MSVSISFDLHDRTEASWTQVTGVAEQIVQTPSKVPVLVDGDIGYGDFNSARQMLDKCGVAFVSLEDKGKYLSESIDGNFLFNFVAQSFLIA